MPKDDEARGRARAYSSGLAQAVVETVPRHRFVPGFYLPADELDRQPPTVWEPVTPELDHGRWLAAAYSDTTLITQFDGDEPHWKAPQVRHGGAPTSSSTLPSLAVRMWARTCNTDLEGSAGPVPALLANVCNSRPCPPHTAPVPRPARGRAEHRCRLRRRHQRTAASTTRPPTLCALSPALSFLIAARVLQGAGASAVAPTSLGLVLPSIPPQRRAAAIGALAHLEACRAWASDARVCDDLVAGHALRRPTAFARRPHGWGGSTRRS
ncbi:hypothetical protein BX281_10561 [Streptomyces sp. Ag82_O1-15]|nr:hypothetical protein BX281_10561 [Streptomyces sp. Ag82_O1-15]